MSFISFYNIILIQFKNYFIKSKSLLKNEILIKKLSYCFSKFFFSYQLNIYKKYSPILLLKIFLSLAILKLMYPYTIKKIKKGKRIFYIPQTIKYSKELFNAWNFLKKGILLNKSNKPFYLKMFYELINIVFYNKGKSFFFIQNIYKEFSINKHLIHFRW